MKNKAVAFLLPVLYGAIACTCFAQQSSTPSPSTPAASETERFNNSQLSMEERVNDLISHMTLEEKVSQLGDNADAVPRLGIPAYHWWSEGLHGDIGSKYATVFPQAIGLAASFDTPLMHQVADVVSTEFRAKYLMMMKPDGSSDQFHGLDVWAPNINIFRDPRWGRGQETYGEDPYLTARMAVAYVTGMQGEDQKYFKTISTPKHFAVHSGPEPTRHTVDVQASRHDMEDTYLPGFRAAITEAKAYSVMCAYNSLNGQPACANQALLDEHLRHDWGFEGYVVSDCGAVTDIFRGHHFTKSMEEGVSAAFKAGTDLVCGFPASARAATVNAVHQGLLAEADLDRLLRRLFTARLKLGLFDPAASVPYAQIGPEQNDTEEHRQLALRMARESIVLLKNKDNFLPLKQKLGTIAVIGPNADSLDALEGNYHGTPSKYVTVLEGIKRRFAQSKVIYVDGTGLIGPATRAVPAEMLYSDASRKEHGLKAEYFPNIKLEGAPFLSRTEERVDIAALPPGIAQEHSQNYSARWTGVLVAPDTGDYLVGFNGKDGYRVWLDSDLIAEDWTTHRPARTRTKKLHLEKDHTYVLKIEHYQTNRAPEAHLVWTMPQWQGPDALDAARKADLVVMVLGLSARIEGEEMDVHADGFAGGDRTSLDLPAPQEQLLEQVVAAGKPTALVLMSGSAVALNWADQNVPAIIEAWYPGEEGGTAVAEALAGDFSPAGRLPVTFYKSVDQLPTFEDYSMAKRTYRYFSGEPLYPFGYGLSYTSFKYSNPHADNAKIAADGTVTISVDVANTGAVAGDEVVQVYLTHTGVPGAPLRALQGFRRVHLGRGEHRVVSFPLRDRDLSIVDEAGKHRIVPGAVKVWVGGGQPVTRSALPKTAGVETQFTITSEATLPD